MKFSCGLVSVSFRKNTPEQILSKMKEAGLETIEWGSDIHAPCDDTEKLQNIAVLQKHHNITCCSYGTYFRLGINSTEELCQYIKAAKVLGTDILRIWCGDKNSEEYSKEERISLIKEGRKAAEIAKSYGVILCLECHNNTHTNTLNGAMEIIEEVNSPNFRMYWQPNQHRDFKTNCAYAKNIAPFTYHIHVFNWEGANRYPLKDGEEVWKEYLSNFDGHHTLLLEFMPRDSLDELKEEALALKRIIGETE